MRNDMDGTELFCNYYKQWIEVYKKDAIREATMAKYLMTQKWVEKLVPRLKVSDLTRTVYQQRPTAVKDFISDTKMMEASRCVINIKKFPEIRMHRHILFSVTTIFPLRYLNIFICISEIPVLMIFLKRESIFRHFIRHQ